MFRIGEFAQVAQVSGRQLRHYDQLGLLVPQRIDPQTGYRYYSIRQLPRLNRILALKDLGLTLEQIGPMLEDRVSVGELRAMLTLRRTQAEQAVAAEGARLRQIESRIAQLDEDGVMADCDVVVKSAPAQPFLALRTMAETLAEAVTLVRAVNDAGRALTPSLRDRLMVVARMDHDDERLDVEVGFTLTRPTNQTLRIAGERLLALSELPAAPILATVVRMGPSHERHFAFGALGGWIEANEFAVDGPAREVILELGPSPEQTLIEIQFPVRRAA